MQQNKPTTKITVLGAGAWGTAVAIALAARHDVLLWGRNPQQMADTDAARDNLAYLPGHPLPPALRVSADFEAALAHVAPGREEDAPLLILACPVAGLRPLLEQLRGRPIPNVVWLCKGFEAGTGLLPHQVVAQVLGDSVPGAALSGPSFAQEVARGLPCALTVASSSAELRERVVAAAHGDNLRVYSHDDLIGVEVGGAVKNVMAIATGAADAVIVTGFAFGRDDLAANHHRVDGKAVHATAAIPITPTPPADPAPATAPPSAPHSRRRTARWPPPR